MFDHKHYVPIIKWKQGEILALSTLKNTYHGKFTPLIELPFIETNFKENRPARSIEEHLSKISKSVKKKLIEPTAFIDFKFIDVMKQLKNSQLALDFYDNSKKAGINIIPVVSPNSSEVTITSAKANRENGICFRIPESCLDNIQETIKSIKQNFQSTTLNNIDLVLDLGSIMSSQLSVLNILINSIIDKVPNLNKWRTITISSSAFPVDLSNIDGDKTAFIPRHEWKSWQNRYKNPKGLRMPTFGDYPIAHPDLKDLDFRIITRSASIRYSDDDNWIVIKGRSTKKIPQSKQYRSKSQILISMDEYYGSSYSWGDEFIDNCANGGKCGNASTWRQVGVNHHITLVINQLSNLS